MIKHILYCLILFASISSLKGQLIAHDFQAHDIDGNFHHLYNILDSNKVVIVDASATWCFPCWEMHNYEVLKDINDTWGPNGTDQLRVFLVEVDPATTHEDLIGIGDNTFGDFTEGANYPIIDQDTLLLEAEIYAPLGLPTVSFIRPDRVITLDLFENWQYSTLHEAVQNELDSIFGTTTAIDEISQDLAISIFPNPATDFVDIDLSNSILEQVEYEITDISGKALYNGVISGKVTERIEITDAPTGVLLITLTSDSKDVASQKIIKQ